MSTVLREYLPWLPLRPIIASFEEACTYETYVAGVGCKFVFKEPVSRAKLLVGMDACPASDMPYISITCQGRWCDHILKPCSLSLDECGVDGLICRQLMPGSGPERVVQQMAGWLRDWKLLNGIQEFSGFNAISSDTDAYAAFMRTIRAKLNQYWNITRPDPLVRGGAQVERRSPPRAPRVLPTRESPTPRTFPFLCTD